VSTETRSRKFTSTYISALKPSASVCEILDPAVPGLVLRVATSGSKAWLFPVKWEGVGTRICLGKFPAVSLAEARQLAVLFAGRNVAAHLSTRQYSRIVHRWIVELGVDASAYGTHSIRRTKASLIYRRTKNLRAVQLLLGHTKLESTVRYLGIEVDDALENGRAD
jgi:site-specific recombinase XerC